MNLRIIVLTVLLIIASFVNGQNIHNSNKIENTDLQLLLNDSKVNGVILIYDSNNNRYYSNNFKEATKSAIPASTYKIPHSIIGLETGVLKDENTIFKWHGDKRSYSIWEKDLSLKQAFQNSCVPCYQELAKKIGVKRMQANLKKLKFGKMYVDAQTINNFWLVGKSEINPFEQIDFLKRLYNQELEISKSTYSTIKNILIIEEKEDYILSGKTGLANNIGWFVGYLEKRGNTFYFATKVTPKEANLPTNKFISIRKSVTIEAFKKLNIM